MTTETPEILSFGPVYEQLGRELAAIHHTWRGYRELFATNEARFDLIQEMAPSLGWQLHQILVHEAIAGICRLTDPPKQSGKNNLVFAQLKDHLNPVPNAEQSAWLDAELGKLESSVAPLRTYRNKKLSHLDLDHSLNRADKLEEITRQSIEDALRIMRDMMNAVQGWHSSSETWFDVDNSGVKQLLWCLRFSKRLDELQDDYYCHRLTNDEIIEKLRNRQLAEF